MSIGSLARGVSAFCIVIFLLAFVGCATTFKQNALTRSTQNNAEVVLRNSEGVEVFRGVTPATVRIPPGGDFSVLFILPGYKEQNPFVFKKEEEEKKEEKEKKRDSDWSFDLCDPNDCDSNDCGSNDCGSDDCDSDDCDLSGCDLRWIGGEGFGVNRLFSPVRDLGAGQIAINLVTALSNQNINETYLVFHTRHHGHVRTLTVPFIRQ